MHLLLLVLRRVELAGKFVHGSTTFPGSPISARSLICKIDRDELLQVLVKSYLEL